MYCDRRNPFNIVFSKYWKLFCLLIKITWTVWLRVMVYSQEIFVNVWIKDLGEIITQILNPFIFIFIFSLLIQLILFLSNSLVCLEEHVNFYFLVFTYIAFITWTVFFQHSFPPNPLFKFKVQSPVHHKPFPTTLNM